MKNVQLVILMGGKATRLAPLTYALPKGLLTINNKPGIYNMLYDFVNKGLNDITIIVSPSNHDIVKSFFEQAFNNVNINIVVQENPKGPLHAFQLAQPYINKSTLLLLGDTSCETDFKFDTNWLGYMDITDNSHSRWCLIETDENNIVKRQIDKPKEKPNTDKVLVGVYFFKNANLLKESLNQDYKLKHNELQLSSAIDYYANKEKFHALKIKKWSDSGALNTYADTIKKINSKEYDFKVDDFLTVEKIAKCKNSLKKLKNEANWLLKTRNLPISSLFSKILSFNDQSYSMEFLDYTSLFEYFNFYPMPLQNMNFIFDVLLKNLNFLHNQKLEEKFDENKLRQQTQQFYTQTFEKIMKNLNAFSQLEKLEVNKIKLIEVKNFLLEKKLEIENLAQNAIFGLVHNNLIFSNILYLQKVAGIKFLSPKGFNGNLSGDIRLDFAALKLNYDFRFEGIQNNMFMLQKNTEFDYDFSWMSKKMPQTDFDNQIKNFADISSVSLIAIILMLKSLDDLTKHQKIVTLFSIAEFLKRSKK